MRLKYLIVASMLLQSAVPFASEKVNAKVIYSEPIYNKPVRINLTTIQKSNYTINIKGGYSIKEKPDILLSDGTYSITNENQQINLYKEGAKIFSGSQMTLFPVQYDLEHTVNFANEGKTYLGSLAFTIQGSIIKVENKLYLEHYLYGVVPYEMSDSWGDQGLEALKAQAVVARSYAAARASDTVLVDTPSNQVYNGYKSSNVNSIKAVNETKGVVLQYNGQPIGDNAFYSSTNGGYALSKVNSWGNYQVPYLKYKADPYDAKVTAHKNWGFTVLKQQINLTGLDLTKPSQWWGSVKEAEANSDIIIGLKNTIKTKANVPAGQEIKIVSIPQLSFTNPQQHSIDSNTVLTGIVKVDYLLFDPSKPTGFEKDENGKIKVHRLEINERTYNFYLNKYLGTSGSYSSIRSPNVTSVVDDGVKYTVTGSGWGHGIGMSQWGAYQMAKEGKSYLDILQFYYEGTTITPKTNEDPAVNPTLPTESNDPVNNNPTTPSEPVTKPQTPTNSNNEPTIKNPKYFEVLRQTPIYDNRTGNLEVVGYLLEGQQFPITKDYGANWWQIRFGNIYGYVYKGDTKGILTPTYRNKNEAKNSQTKFKVTADVKVYDNTSGSLVPFAVLKKGVEYPVISQMGNWWRVDVDGRLGYVHNSSVTFDLNNTKPQPTVTNPNTNSNTNTVTTKEVYYTVQKGDTLYKIATKYGVSVQSIQQLNGLKTTTIQVGQKLLIKKGETTVVSKPAQPTSTVQKIYHTVQQGETLYRIATKYGVSVSTIQSLNGLKNAIIYVGQKLLIR